MDILSLLVSLIVICLIWWALTAIIGAFGLGDPIATLVKVVFVVVVVLYLLATFTGYSPPIRLR